LSWSWCSSGERSREGRLTLWRSIWREPSIFLVRLEEGSLRMLEWLLRSMGEARPLFSCAALCWVLWVALKAFGSFCFRPLLKELSRVWERSTFLTGLGWPTEFWPTERSVRQPWVDWECFDASSSFFSSFFFSSLFVFCRDGVY